MDEDGWLTDPATLFPILAHSFNIPIREVTLYARHLREGGKQMQIDLYPAIVGGRGSKLQITPRHAAYLVLALATSPAAMTAADYAVAYGESKVRKGSVGPSTERTLIQVFEDLIQGKDTAYSVSLFLHNSIVLVYGDELSGNHYPAHKTKYFLTIDNDPRRKKRTRDPGLDELAPPFSVDAHIQKSLFTMIASAYPAAAQNKG